MKIEKINIQNFYSFKDVSLDLSDYRGLTLIKGKNKDGNNFVKNAISKGAIKCIVSKKIKKRDI